MARNEISFLDHCRRLGDCLLFPSEEHERLQKTLSRHIPQNSIRSAVQIPKADIRRKIVTLLFDAQDRRCLWWKPREPGDPLSATWNSPGKDGRYWKLDYIKYQWGHLVSKNQIVHGHHIEDSITNLVLMSAHCNENIFSSMTVEQVMSHYKGCVQIERMRKVFEQRADLFSSSLWKNLVAQLQNDDTFSFTSESLAA